MGLTPFLLRCAGAATVLAFAPFELHPLAFLTLRAARAPVDATRRRGAALWLGFWFGLGLFGAGVSWVYVSLHQFGGMPAPLAALRHRSASAPFSRSFPAAAGWLQARVPAPRCGARLPAHPGRVGAVRVAAACWIFTGFPWLAVGYAAAGWPLQGYAPLGGVYALSFLTVSVAGMLWLLAAARGRAVARRRSSLVLGAGEALRHVAVDRAGRRAGQRRAAAGKHRAGDEVPPRALRSASSRPTRGSPKAPSARLIVLPETALPRFFDQVDPAYLARLDAAAKRNDGDLLLGVPYRARARRVLQQRAHARRVAAAGAITSRTWCPSASSSRRGFGWMLRVAVDSALRLQRAARPTSRRSRSPASASRSTSATRTRSATRSRAALPEATLLVNVSNVAWFGDSLAPAQHLQIARLRAIETGRMHLTATNTGITAAIDRDGRVLARLPQFTEGRLEIAAQGYSGATPYVRLRDWPVVARFARHCSRSFVARRAAQPLESAACSTFQQLILQLNAFWDRQGCALLQPYDMEVGAGTFHTATFLRAIGPEPWNAAYVQPSRRPKDGRYGDNPNRLQHYYQYQVVLKPSPADIQDLYLDSLKDLGIDPQRARHPLRRGRLGVADARRLGPGLGSVARRHGGHAVHLLPGSRRPRLQAGARRDHLRPRAPGDVPAGQGQRLRPGVDARASPTATSITRTRSSSRSYNFELSNTDMLFRHFGEFEGEAKRLIAAQCVLPGYEMVMKSSHTFNLLDARGAISVTERAAYIGRVRALATRRRAGLLRVARAARLPDAEEDAAA